MGFLGVVLLVVFIATAFLLVGIILIQDEQGEGLGGIFGGGSTTPFGSRSGNVLTRFTSILGAIFLICAFGIAWVNRGGQAGDVVAAAKRQATTTATEWWNTKVDSNGALPTGTSPASNQAGGGSAVPPGSSAQPPAGPTGGAK